MKNLVITLIISLLTAGWSIAGAQNYPDEYLGLPGDNLNLYAVMKLFQESETLEDFEKNLNDENTMVNNLDLNGDNLVDYIMVYDYVDRNVHNIVLRVAINQNETQDVAVFTVQQFDNGSVQLQLIGDELLYGENYIVEPYYAENGATPNPGYVGNTRAGKNVTVVHTNTYHVAEWPVIRYIYLPSYTVWRSSWYWGYRPVYWNPWRPFYWHTYYGYHSHYHHHYHAHYRHWNHYRYSRYKNHYYTSIRTYSPRITVNINKGVYKKTYSRPDLKERGEVLYARKNSGRNSTSYRNSANGRTRAASTSTARRVRTNTQNNSGNRSAVRASARQRSNTAVNQRNSAARKSANVRSNRNNTNPSVRQNSGATRNTSVTRVRKATEARSARKSTGTAVRQGSSNNDRAVNIKNSTVRSTNRAVRSSSANTSKRPAVTRQARSSTPRKSATISSGNTTRRSAVSRSTNNVSRRSAPSVSRQRAPKTKSASKVSSSRSSRRSAPKVSTSRSTSRKSAPSVSRSSSSRSSSPSVKSSRSSSSSRGSSRRR
ncbi:hypothetical protein SAMN05444280_12842 [Tangfeifania diversioriginum]|uniref:DUF3300 domain-containing protein n=1 Tax=Tangfeifania diversioriginum TaxID=1168035 RepID=A0A1M6LV17_9BACT|nr:hypothetical protein [Tangfeifania diversioriginum]SHJ74995.1 hypothetical protein SAMN05444280_12842 [Tangfeifania diversioriginum]